MQSVKAMTFAAVLALAAEQAQATKCYALAFGSGGESSAYTAGALKGLVSHYGAAATSYTAVSGVSGGAINAALLGKYAKGKELDGANRMITFWEHASTNHLWKDWLGGISQGLLFKGGLYNTAPLTTFLKGELSDVVSFQRAVFTGITDVLNGAYVDYNNNTLISHLADVAFASLSFAGVFPPAEVLGGSYFDGGVVWGIDIFSAVNECLKTHSQANTVVDVLLTSAKNLKQVDASNYLSINMLWRYLEISRYYGNMDGLLRAQFAYPDVTFRSIVSPTKDLPSSTIPLNFTKTQVDSMVAQGVADAKSASLTVNNSEDTLHYFAMVKANKDILGDMNYDQFVEKKKSGLYGNYADLLQQAEMKALFLQ